MSQDTSNIQVIEKFSFIYTLTRSNYKNIKQLAAKKVSVEVQEFTDNSHHEPCHELVHSSSSESVTLSSVLGFPNLALTNGSGLSLGNELAADYSLDLPEQLKFSAEINQSNQFIFRHLGKIVFALSSSYLIFVAWWLAGHSYYGQLFPFSALRTVLNISGQEISAADLQFIDYMERSLESIHSEESTELSNSGNKQENSEVVYVPVYNLTKNNSPLPMNHSNLPFPSHSSINNSSLPIPIIPPPPPIKSSTSAFSRSSMSMSKSNRKKVSLPTSLPSSPISSNIIPKSNTSTLKNYTLLGIFELGKRSAALFKVDGVTKRIWVGEKLNNEGWTLDSVTNQKAKITRQGEIRSLSVGEKF